MVHAVRVGEGSSSSSPMWTRLGVCFSRDSFWPLRIRNALTTLISGLTLVAFGFQSDLLPPSYAYLLGLCLILLLLFRNANWTNRKSQTKRSVCRVPEEFCFVKLQAEDVEDASSKWTC